MQYDFDEWVGQIPGEGNVISMRGWGKF